SEVRALLGVVTAAGGLMLVGGAIELAGTAAVLDVGWLDALTDGSAPGAMMRLLGGALVLLGLGDEMTAADPDAAGDDAWRWSAGATSAFGIVGAAIGVASFAFDGHTTTEGPRVLHAVVNAVHVSAAAVWFGGLVAIVVVVVGRTGAVGPLLVGFSRLATVSLVAVALAGATMAALILDDPSGITGTDWGRRLLVKVGAVVVAASLGAYHHLAVVPRLPAGDIRLERTTRRTLLLEVVVLAVAVVMSAVVSHSSIA
ncbi:MAG: CopD family protein, partial [Acidimicrobiia bacterium]